MVDAVNAAFPDYGLRLSVGGQISFDLFPNGWDKTCVCCVGISRGLEQLDSLIIYIYISIS